jgi:hypothetical protein
MTLLDGALIGLVVLIAIGVIAVVSHMLGDEDGGGDPEGPWPRWSSHDRR